MATEAKLTAQKREGTGKGVARKLRAGGRIPAVLYGRDMETVHLSVDAHEAGHLFHAIAVDNTIVSLEVEGDKEAHETLVRDIQTHPWKGSLVHIDFYRIQAGVEVDVDVPVHLNGIPKGVKDDGGTLEQTIHDLPVRCIPSKIPESIEIDVSHLEINDVIHIYDIDVGEGVEVRIAQERTICSVAMPRAEEEPEVDEDLLEPELVDGAEGEEPTGEAESDAGDDDSGDDS